METTLHILSFLYEEEKIPFFLTTPGLYFSLLSEIREIQLAYLYLRDYHLDNACRAAMEQELLNDLESDSSVASS